MKCLFTNIQKQKNILKISLLFKKKIKIIPELLGLTMRNFQGIVFIRTRRYSEIFKSELVYL